MKDITTTERLARYETAQETLGLMIAAISKKIRDEKLKESPDNDLINTWKAEQNAFADKEDALLYSDTHGIDYVLKTYAPIVKASFLKRGKLA
jgi:hypothetical protein